MKFINISQGRIGDNRSDYLFTRFKPKDIRDYYKWKSLIEIHRSNLKERGVWKIDEVRVTCYFDSIQPLLTLS